MKQKTVLLLAAALVAASPISKALPASLTIGELTFSNFNVTGGFDTTGVSVTPSLSADGTYSISFNGPWTTQGNVDFNIWYSVTSNGRPINMIGQAFTLTALGNGGMVAIGEQVRTDSFTGPTVAWSSVGFVLPGIVDGEDPVGEVGDNLYVNPGQTTLWVTKDVHMRANEGGLVGATLITQSFHVPDGGMTAMMLGIGILSLGALRRKN